MFLLFQNPNQAANQIAENANQATTEKVLSASQNATNTVIEMINGFWAQLPVIAVGVVVFIVFLIIASVVRKIIRAASERARIDVMLSSLLARIGYILVIIFGLFVAIVVIFPGVSPGDLFAGLGIGSVALGFAFKDVLQNLFAGFLILIYRPFHIGDQIKINDFEGTVEEINVRATKIKTYDGERVVIPNNDLYMDAVLVRTAFPHRRTKIVVGIGYDDDHELARRILLDVLKNTEGVLETPAPDVNVYELADSSVNMRLLYWTDSQQSSTRKTADRVVSGVKAALDKAGIEIPFPQRVLTMYNDRLKVESVREENSNRT
ncbi:MAG: mechanosensitive ion channel family protein [Pyrinomonadaceae bacterium]